MSRREIFLIITIGSIFGTAYPYLVSHFPTQIEWTTVVHTSSVLYSNQISLPWTLFNATESFSSGAIIDINVTYSSYSCPSAAGCTLSPEVCMFTVIGLKQINVQAPLDQQAADCGGSESYTYNNVTKAYIITFQQTVPESSEYEFISRLVSSCSAFEFQCPTYASPTLMITAPSAFNPLQAYGDPQLVSVLMAAIASIFGYATYNEQRRQR